MERHGLKSELTREKRYFKIALTYEQLFTYTIERGNNNENKVYF